MEKDAKTTFIVENTNNYGGQINRAWNLGIFHMKTRSVGM